MIARKPPTLHLVANLWTLWDHPSVKREWSLERKIAEIKAAGFNGLTDRLDRRHAKLAGEYELCTVGFVTTTKPSEYAGVIRQNVDLGARRINVHLGKHDTPTQDAIRMAIRLIEEGEKQGVPCDIETHRDTCTETPEKTYKIADGYKRATGRVLPLTWDFSHFAVVKHLSPPYSDRLIERATLVQAARQFHFRPFNGHHCQIPVTQPTGQHSPEFRDWLPMLATTLKTWLGGDQSGADLYVCPEMGPVRGGYNLARSPNSWDETKVLRRVIRKAWITATGVRVRADLRRS